MVNSILRGTWLAIYGAVLFVLLGAAPPQGDFPLPGNEFYGRAFLGADAAPAGLQILACVNGCEAPAGYEGHPIITQEGGLFNILKVDPSSHDFLGKEISFYIVTEFGRMQATDTSILSNDLDLLIRFGFGLHFDSQLPTPPPTPTPAPTPTPPPTPTPTPTPALPIPGDPAVPQLVTVTMYLGFSALVAGLIGVLWATRRRSRTW